ncbi:MAG: K+/H+ antiporter subunit F [Alphaproteobacteria bacterium]|nr:K+/H+ antiporter subunit F [Alphaproteobacteria bacterium]
MIEIAAMIALGAASLAVLLNLYRLLAGPGIADRILALDTLTINAIALVVIFGILFGTGMYFEVALLFAMVGFLGTVALCKYLLRGNVIE